MLVCHRIITNTNIIVDDFDFCKSFPKDTFIHFLTHFHSDHYEGLTPLWDYGPIYCSHQTKKFILNKFPKLTRIYSYDFYNFHQLTVGKENNMVIRFCLFDAKHIPGSSMIYLEGYMGRILFTGDFRYEFNMVKENSILFPLFLRNEASKEDIVEKMEGISIHIDEMIFDNTYCNEVFKFGRQDEICQKMINIIKRNLHKKLIYIAMGALGKNRILIKIAQHFQTTIVISQKQLSKIAIANIPTHFFTINPDEGFIHLISKKNRAIIVQQTQNSQLRDNFICIDTDFLMLEHQSPDQINYIVPYSLHSNYHQMRTFIKMIQPSILRKIVIPYANFKQIKLRMKIDHRLKFAKYLEYLENINRSNSGYSNLVNLYTDITKLSKDYLRWFKPQQSQKLEKMLGVGQQDHAYRKRPVILLEQNQLDFNSKSKQTLSDIADKLNAVNKNLTLEKAYEKRQNNQVKKLFSSIFNDFQSDI